MTMTCVIVRFPRGVRVAGIGAAFRVERSLDLGEARAQPPHHFLDDMIAPDAQAAAGDLRLQVAVTQMPGQADQMLRVVATDLHERLRGRDDLDQPAVFEHQRVAAPQRDRGFQVEQKRKPARAGHRHSPPVTVVEVEHDRIGRRFDKAMLSSNLGSPDHRTASRNGGLDNGLAK
jgi:hypothetical protein